MGDGSVGDEDPSSDSLLRAVAHAPDAAVPEGLAFDGTLRAEDKLVGHQLLHFRVVERLGAGGMGVVYRAFDEKLQRAVALKVLAAKFLVDDRNKGLILREARSAAAVHHPNIATIYDVHDAPEAAFLAMELVEGETLRERLARGAAPIDEALAIATQIVDALACAHAVGLVHRDLKPDNVMIARDGRVKLLDFGLATLADADEAGDPLHAHVIGTPAYMAPEQARGEAVDARADVFAFGVVLCEMLAGERPNGRALEQRVGAKAAALVMRCLEPERERRFADARALSLALADLQRARAKPRWRLLGAASALAVAGVVGVVMLASGGTHHAATSEPAPARVWTERTLTSLESNLHVWIVALANDRSRIAFIAGETLWVQDMASGERTNLGNVPSVRTGRQGWYSLSWFPDGHALLFGSSGNPLEIIDLATHVRRTLPVIADLARLSPDGKRLAWVDNRTTVRVEPVEGAPHAGSSILTFDPKHPIWDVAWTPSGRRLAVLTETANPADMEAVVADADGAHRHVVSHGMFFTKDANVGLTWRSDDRLLVVRAGAHGGAAEILEVVLDPRGEPLSEAPLLQRLSTAEPSAIVAVGDSIAFVLDEVQDDVFIAGMAATGDALDRPFARATQSDSREALIGWTSATRFAFLSNRGQADRLIVFEQEIGGTPRAIGGGGDMYAATRPGVLTEAGDVLYWRGGEGADPPRPCELVRLALRDGSESVVAVPDEQLACRGRVACSAGRCAISEKRAWAWLDLATGKRSGQIARDAAKQVLGWDLIAVSRDGRLAAAESDGTASGSQVTLVRADGAREQPMHVDGIVQSLSFAPDGRHLYATTVSTSGEASLIALDAQGVVHVLNPPDGRWGTNPWVSGDGRNIAMTVRSRRENVGLLDLEPPHR